MTNTRTRQLFRKTLRQEAEREAFNLLELRGGTFCPQDFRLVEFALRTNAVLRFAFDSECRDQDERAFEGEAARAVSRVKSWAHVNQQPSAFRDQDNCPRPVREVKQIIWDRAQAFHDKHGHRLSMHWDLERLTDETLRELCGIGEDDFPWVSGAERDLVMTAIQNALAEIEQDLADELASEEEA